MTHAAAPNPLAGRSLRAPVLWGVVWGVLQAAAPLGFRWLEPATVYALSIALIAAVYIGFAVADGRPRVIAVETHLGEVPSVVPLEQHLGEEEFGDVGRPVAMLVSGRHALAEVVLGRIKEVRAFQGHAHHNDRPQCRRNE